MWDELEHEMERSPFVEPMDLDAETAAVNSSCVGVEGMGSVAHLFYLLDSDGDGSLDIEELTVVHGSEKQLRDFFSLWDKDQDNRISLNEFLLYFVDLFRRKGSRTVNVVIKNWYRRATQIREMDRDIQLISETIDLDIPASTPVCVSDDMKLAPSQASHGVPLDVPLDCTTLDTNSFHGCPEGASNGLGIAPNGCRWERPIATVHEEERKIYNASVLTADTMYCHHFNEAGQHLVLHGLPSTSARHCCGVIYMSVGWSGKKLCCKEQRRPKQAGKDAGHDKCNVKTCAFIAEGLQCPYMPLGFTPMRVLQAQSKMTSSFRDDLP